MTLYNQLHLTQQSFFMNFSTFRCCFFFNLALATRAAERRALKHSSRNPHFILLLSRARKILYVVTVRLLENAISKFTTDNGTAVAVGRFSQSRDDLEINSGAMLIKLLEKKRAPSPLTLISYCLVVVGLFGARWFSCFPRRKSIFLFRDRRIAPSAEVLFHFSIIFPHQAPSSRESTQICAGDPRK